MSLASVCVYVYVCVYALVEVCGHNWLRFSNNTFWMSGSSVLDVYHIYSSPFPKWCPRCRVMFVSATLRWIFVWFTQGMCWRDASLPTWKTTYCFGKMHPCNKFTIGRVHDLYTKLAFNEFLLTFFLIILLLFHLYLSFLGPRSQLFDRVALLDSWVGNHQTIKRKQHVRSFRIEQNGKTYNKSTIMQHVSRTFIVLGLMPSKTWKMQILAN